MSMDLVGRPARVARQLRGAEVHGILPRQHDPVRKIVALAHDVVKGRGSWKMKCVAEEQISHVESIAQPLDVRLIAAV